MARITVPGGRWRGPLRTGVRGLLFAAVAACSPDATIHLGAGGGAAGQGVACSESAALDLGAPNAPRTVPADGCVQVTEYPGDWVESVVLQVQSAIAEPVPFEWTNCAGSGADSFNNQWDQRTLTPASNSCPTVIGLSGSPSDSLTLSWWGGT